VSGTRRRVAAGRDAARRLADKGRAMAQDVVARVGPIRRTLDELIRVEFIDRSIVVAAQALLALVPLVVVLAAFAPRVLGDALDRLETVTGVSHALIDHGYPPTATTTEAGVVGLVIAVLAASSFARAMMRAYERIWDVRAAPGVAGRVRATVWLVEWIIAMQVIFLAGRLDSQLSHLLPSPLPGATETAFRFIVASAVWWWTMWYLLNRHVPWSRLWVAAVLTGVATVGYTSASAVVMPHYARQSAGQYGGFGLVLAMSSWLLGFAFVMVVAGIIGRVLTEDPFLGPILAWIGRLPDRGAVWLGAGFDRGRRSGPDG
jgi:membrane protein